MMCDQWFKRSFMARQNNDLLVRRCVRKHVKQQVQPIVITEDQRIVKNDRHCLSCLRQKACVGQPCEYCDLLARAGRVAVAAMGGGRDVMDSIDNASFQVCGNRTLVRAPPTKPLRYMAIE